MTNETEQLRRMVEARERATKGPWYAYEGKVRLESQLDGPEIASTWGQTDATKSWGGANEISDACFIALSGTIDLRAILTRMEKMEAALQPFADAATEAEKWGGAAESVIANSVSLSDCKRAKEAFE